MRYLGGKALLRAGMFASAIAFSVAAGGFMAKPAEARVFVGVGIGVGPYCCGYYHPYAYPYPYSYGYPSYGYPAYPYPTYVAPPTVVQQVAPVQNTSAPVWYFCDNPSGYYPYVQNCSVSWRAVAPTQAPPKQPDPSSAPSPAAPPPPPAGAVVQ